MRRRGLLSLAFILLAGCDASGRGLSPIRLEPIVTLGATSGDGAIATTPAVSPRHPAGYRIVIPAASAIGTQPLVYADDGRFLGALHGEGTPAGNLSGAMFARMGPGDSIWLFDNSARVLVFGSDRNFARMMILPNVPLDAIVLADSRIVVSPGHGAVVELLAADGTIVRGIGGADSASGTTQTGPMILPVPDGTFWTASRAMPWQLNHWDTAGTHRGVARPAADWLRPDAVARGGVQHSLPTIQASWIEGEDRLWVVGSVADEQWEQGLGTSDPAHTDGGRAIDNDKYFDTVVEVRSVSTGALIATARFNFYISSMSEPGVLVHEIRTSAGWHRAELLRVVYDETSRH